MLRSNFDMKIFTILPAAIALSVLLSSSSSTSYAALARLDDPFQVLPGQRLYLKGDSITKGYGFGNYTNPSPLRTVYGIANILLKGNLLYPPQMRSSSFIWEGLNADGTPKTVDSLAGEIQIYIRSGELRPGDWLIYEDAGGLNDFVHAAPYPNTNQIYRRYREALRDMVLEAQGTVDREHIRFMTMFDYKVPRWCAWDAPLDDAMHTGNDAIRDEAAALGVRVIDMNRIMDRAEEYIEARQWGRLVGPDGIHPNSYGNFVMTLAILESLGADIAQWKLDGLFPHFRHPETGGDVENIWGFKKDPDDAERMTILEDLRKLVVQETKPTEAVSANAVASSNGTPQFYPTAHSFRQMLRHGRLLDHPATQPIGTDKPASYEIAKIFQLDQETALLVTSLREQGGHDFEIGNDGFIFRKLSEIVPKAAFPINRLETNYTTRAGEPAVLAKYPVHGIIIPLGAKLENNTPHPAAGSGFLISTLLSFTPDRAEVTPNPDQFVELYQVRWDGKELKVEKDKLPEPYASSVINVGFNCLIKGEAVLCPVVSDQGIEVLLFEHKEGRWQPTRSGGNFATIKKTAKIGLANVGPGGKQFALVRGEMEPSLVQLTDGYMVHTRGPDTEPKGRFYWSQDGLRYYFKFDHWNHTVPQVLNQGLDGSLYLTTNTGPGRLRNPLYAYALRGLSLVDPIILHDEKQIRDVKGKEIPFCDHAMGENVFLNGRWRHLITYRVLDLRETNGEGAPPTPQTGLYLAEFEYDTVTHAPFRF
jgi:hypothetical protein